MRKVLQTISCSFVILATASFADEIPGSRYSSGNWEGAAYTNNESGQFSHCAISAPYISGDSLHLSVNRDASVSVAVRSPNLNLNPGFRFPVALYVDRRAPFYGEAEVVFSDFAVLRLQDFDKAMTALRKGYVLKITGAGREGTYNLTGTFRALERARQCAIQYYDYKQPSTTSSSTTAAGTSQGIDPAISYQLATQMITSLGVTDARYLTKAELEEIEMSGAVYWSSDMFGISGGVMFFPLVEDRELREGDNIGFDFLSNGCEGNYATTAQDIGEDKSSRQLRLLCTQEAADYEGYLTLSPVGEHLLVTVLFFNEGANLASGTTKAQLSEDIGIRNASFVLENLEN